MNNRVVRVGVAIIVIRDGALLMLRRKNSHGDGTWSVPGGHLDFGETIEECAVRETKEETGVDVTNVRFVGITNDIFEREEKHYITVWTVADYAGGEATLASPREGSEVGWKPLGLLPSPLFLCLKHFTEGRALVSTEIPQDVRVLMGAEQVKEA